MHLKHFSVDKKIYIYDKRSMGLLSKKPIPIKKAAVQNWFYDRDNFIEKKLCRLETKADKIFLKIIRTKQVNNLNNKERKIIDKFIVFQDYRTPKTRNYLKVILNQALKDYIEIKKKGPIDENSIPEGVFKTFWESNPPPKENLLNFLDIIEEDQEFFEKFTEERAKIAINNVIRGELISGIDLFSKLVVKLYINRSRHNFYTSDHPVCRYNEYMQNHYNLIPSDGIAYDSKGIQLFYPLTPKLCLLFEDAKTYKKYNKVELAGKEFAEFVNTRLIQNSTQWLYSKDNNFEYAEAYLREYPHFKYSNILFGLWKLIESDLNRRIWDQYYGPDARRELEQYLIYERKKGAKKQDIEALKIKYHFEYINTLAQASKKIRCPICEEELIKWEVTNQINCFNGKCLQCKVKFVNRSGSLFINKIRICPGCGSEGFGWEGGLYKCSECNAFFKLDTDKFILEI